MRILVLGATGGTGREVVEQALGHGHQVVAFVRDPASLDSGDPNLTFAIGDVTDPAAVQAAVGGCDAVVSALGPRGEHPVHVYSDGIANTIRAMTARGVSRLVVVSAAGVGSGDGRGLPLRTRAMKVLPAMRETHDDMERMEGDIMLSDLRWTIVRPVSLVDGPLTGVYRAVPGTAVPKGARISRADLAALLLKCAEGDLYVRTAVAVAY
jgi:putative NADH-flavin reductase